MVVRSLLWCKFCWVHPFHTQCILVSLRAGFPRDMLLCVCLAASTFTTPLPAGPPVVVLAAHSGGLCHPGPSIPCSVWVMSGVLDLTGWLSGGLHRSELPTFPSVRALQPLVSIREVRWLGPWLCLLQSLQTFSSDQFLFWVSGPFFLIAVAWLTDTQATCR